MRTLLYAILAIASLPCFAQGVSYQPGNEPPADIWGPVTTQPASPYAPAGIVPPVDVLMQVPAFQYRPLQRAHNGRYTDLATGAKIDYRQDSTGNVDLTVLLPDDTWASTSFAAVGTERLLMLYDTAGDPVGTMKIATTNIGTACGRLVARAYIAGRLAFPSDPNPHCIAYPPASGQPAPPPPYSYCMIALLGAKIGEAGAGPETCTAQ